MTVPPAIWEIPEPLSTDSVKVDDETTIVLRRHGNPAGPRLVLCHGNGLAIDLYYPFWSLLAAGFDLVVHDLRNHGWNEVGALENHRFDAFSRDHDRIFEAIGRLYGEKGIIYIIQQAQFKVTLSANLKKIWYNIVEKDTGIEDIQSLQCLAPNKAAWSYGTPESGVDMGIVPGLGQRGVPVPVVGRRQDSDAQTHHAALIVAHYGHRLPNGSGPICVVSRRTVRLWPV